MLTRCAPTARALVLLAVSLPALAACQSNREVTGSIEAPADYRERHPIALTNEARIIDLFVEGPSGLTARSERDVGGFLAEYRSHANSGLIAQVPVGIENGAGTRRALDAIRRAAGGRLSVQSYRPTDPTIVSPIRLSFKRLLAKVSTQCGTWPEDVGVSDYEFAAANRTWHNFGCAYNTNLAAQVADPNDLVRGRRETPPDIGRRMYNFEQIRKGTDPSTVWQTDKTSVKQGISQ